MAVILERDLEDIPELWVDWIIAEAARKFQAIQQGDPRRDQQLRADEAAAKAAAMAEEISNIDMNIKNIAGPASMATQRYYPQLRSPY